MRTKVKILDFVKSHKDLLANFSYITILQVFLMVAPLVTYPYLVKVLGMKLYGMVITAQVLASYASLLIAFGTDNVCAKHVSISRNDKGKLSEIISSVLCMRITMWVICALIYLSVVFIIPSYRSYWLLFILTYGFTAHELLFPQFFFQGLEQMKYTTIVNILFKVVFIILVFICVREADDYLLVPVLYTIGYMMGGIYALFVIFRKMGIHFYIPKLSVIKYYMDDASPMLATDLICTIKDKLNYLILGVFSGMGNVVIYDLGMKLYTLTAKPSGIICTVMFPRSAKQRNVTQFNKVLKLIVFVNIALVVTVNVFLPFIVELFLHQDVELLPLRIITLAPLFSCPSAFIMTNLCIAYGYNKYALYSIVITTIAYVIALAIMFFTHFLHSIYAFVLLALISYFVEFLYRVYVYRIIISKEN